MTDRLSSPFYQRLSLNLITLFMISLGLIYGQSIILPFLFSILLANILLPFAILLRKRKINQSISIIVPLLLSIVIGIGILYFLSSQIVHFIDDIPALKGRINEITHSFQVWFRETTRMTIRQQNLYFKETVSNLKENAPELVGITFVSITGMLSYLVLMPLYTFLILYYRSNIKEFLIKVFKVGSEQQVGDILNQSTRIAHRYLIGLLIETTLVFSLNAIGFFILDIKYTIFLALLAALLNLIPYVGMLVANVLCMVITLVSSDDTTKVLWVGAILALVQLLDNNFGMPLIVGNKVRINALVTIMGVLVAGAICGIPGMFLAIPGLAVLKVIFDNVPSLQPWGLLLGEKIDRNNKINKV
jgi:predicted PurR-regulated permease PerM